MKELRTEIDIDAPAERVWACLTDFAAFPEWNPFIRNVRGRLEPGRDSTLSSERPARNRWRSARRSGASSPTANSGGSDGSESPGLFDGEHIFELSPNGPGRVRFVQREVFRGLFVPFLAKSLDRDARRGFEEMNRALRAGTETTPPP